MFFPGELTVKDHAQESDLINPFDFLIQRDRAFKLFFVLVSSPSNDNRLGLLVGDLETPVGGPAFYFGEGCLYIFNC